jgi:hypothetical protein
MHKCAYVCLLYHSGSVTDNPINTALIFTKYYTEHRTQSGWMKSIWFFQESGAYNPRLQHRMFISRTKHTRHFVHKYGPGCVHTKYLMFVFSSVYGQNVALERILNSRYFNTRISGGVRRPLTMSRCNRQSVIFAFYKFGIHMGCGGI